MAHERKRHALPLFESFQTSSPILGVFGHRQVGKTTLIANQIKNYRTLDDETTLNNANHSPSSFLKHPTNTPLAIDECQLAPKLFPALKEWVRTQKKPGQFVLSGSVRFTSRKAIRESLAGRMSFFEILPFTVTELIEEDLSTTLPALLSHRIFSESSLRLLTPHSKLKTLKKHFEVYLENGGLPGLCFTRNPKLKLSQLSDLHDLMLDRDLRMVVDTKLSISTLKKLLGYIASNSLEPYSAAEVQRKIGLSPQTQKNILYALESIFLIRRMTIAGRKQATYLLEDQLEELYYEESHSPIRSYESATFRNIRTQFAYHFNRKFEFESFLTRDGARVPLVIKFESSALGLILIENDRPSLSESRAADSFLQKNIMGKVIFLSTTIINSRVFNERKLICSLYAVL